MRKVHNRLHGLDLEGRRPKIICMGWILKAENIIHWPCHKKRQIGDYISDLSVFLVFLSLTDRAWIYRLLKQNQRSLH